jgi:hypothetical protein
MRSSRVFQADKGAMRKKSTDFLLFSMHMFTILITEMKQGQSSVVSTEKPLRVFFARKMEKSGHL